MKLSGLKESVNEFEKEYYRVQVKQSEQARLMVIARNIIWAYQIDLNTSEKYSPELNSHIEDAFSSKNPSVNSQSVPIGSFLFLLVIIGIERIQSKAWFMQYDSYKRFFPKKSLQMIDGAFGFQNKFLFFYFISFNKNKE